MLRHLNLALAAFIGLGLVAVLLSARSVFLPGHLAGVGAPHELNVAAGRQLLDSGPEAKRTEAAATHVQVQQYMARDVGNGLIAGPVANTVPLERIEPLPQPTPPALPEAPKADETKVTKRWRLVYNSVVTSAGIFEINGVSLVLPGIDVITADEKCTAPNGSTWPCGAAARTAFRNYIRGRAITCNLPDIPLERSFDTECLFQGKDPAEWLVEQGWAKAKPDTTYVAKEATAKSYRRGIYGNPPSDLTHANASRQLVPTAQDAVPQAAMPTNP